MNIEYIKNFPIFNYLKQVIPFDRKPVPISTCLTYIINLDWWKTQIQEKSHEHKGPAAIIVTTAIVITVFWGKLKALGFFAVALVAYPLSHRQIRYFMNLDLYGTTQAAACIGIPILCSKVPFLSGWSMLFHVALGYSILIREWRLCQVTQDSSEAISQLSQLNETLKTQISQLETNASELETALQKLLKEVSEKQDLEEKKQDILQQGISLEARVEIDYEALNKKIARLVTICRTAANKSGLSDTLNEIDEKEQKLEKLIQSCSLKSETLDTLTREIEKLKEKLQDILTKIQQEELQSAAGLEQIQNYLSGILALQV